MHKENELTGLGKISKNADTLSREQVMEIRDLTRYNPSISVVEQGRGASSGYSIRGVDKNRVALSVDGLPQIQSYRNNYGNRDTKMGGAINDVEHENLTSVEISQGADSAEYGSGSLGGAVGLRTKNAEDIVKEGKNWGLGSKTAYSSKNKQWMQSLAAAVQFSGWEALGVFTHRKGHEIRSHKDADNMPQTIERISTNFTNEWFVTQEEYLSGSFTPQRRTDIDRRNNIQEQVPAAKYAGEKRALADPMDYQSRSYLLKLGRNFNQNHYFGGILENTVQDYNIRDMGYRSFWNLKQPYQNDGANIKLDRIGRNGVNKGVYYPHENPFTDLGVDVHGGYAGLDYTRTRYYED